jgi:peptidoglycan/LPS O-acetylase OafA/YrhL
MAITLGQLIETRGSRTNHFDIMRLTAALLVVFSHSFNLSHGKVLGKQYEPLMQLSKGQITLGGLAVLVFFVISGFLITASFDKDKNVLSFFQKRFLRIYPGLIVVVLLTALVLGPLMTELPLWEYFKKPETYNYLVNNIVFIRYQDFLPGVFEHNTVPNYINGSLWTLKYELLCYFVTAILGYFGFLKFRILGVFFIVSSLTNILIQGHFIDNLADWNGGLPFIVKSFLELLPYYLAGSLIYLGRDRLPYRSSFALGSLFLIFVSLPIPGLFKPMFSVVGAYLVFYAAYFPKINPLNLSKVGDLSYGVYIYGWIIQQIVVQWFHPHINWFTNCLISLPFILGASFLSWHLVEKRAMGLKLKISPMFLKKKPI